MDNKDLVEDLIAAELANVFSVLSERQSDGPQKSVLLRSGTVSGETRKQRHGYHVLGPAILLAAMWLLLIFTSLFAAGQNLDLMIRFFRGQLQRSLHGCLTCVNNDSVLFYYIAILSNLFLRTASTLKTILAVLRHTGRGDAIIDIYFNISQSFVNCLHVPEGPYKCK